MEILDCGDNVRCHLGYAKAEFESNFCGGHGEEFLDGKGGGDVGNKIAGECGRGWGVGASTKIQGAMDYRRSGIRLVDFKLFAAHEAHRFPHVSEDNIVRGDKLPLF
jgi:hypothetical protein